MFDFSQVTRFAAKLADASDTDDIEAGWKKDQSQALLDDMDIPRASGLMADTARATADGVYLQDYYRFPEYGTSRMAPRPFVRPSTKRRIGPAADDLGDRVLKELT